MKQGRNHKQNYPKYSYIRFNTEAKYEEYMRIVEQENKYASERTRIFLEIVEQRRKEMK